MECAGLLSLGAISAAKAGSCSSGMLRCRLGPALTISAARPLQHPARCVIPGDAPPTPVQIERALPKAHKLFPLGEPVEPKPWKGARPCLPDMLPIIDRAPRHQGLWFDFGHQHHGLTLGPVTGRLLAEMMTGETPFADPTPFALARFG